MLVSFITMPIGPSLGLFKHGSEQYEECLLPLDDVTSPAGVHLLIFILCSKKRLEECKLTQCVHWHISMRRWCRWFCTSTVSFWCCTPLRLLDVVKLLNLSRNLQRWCGHSWRHYAGPADWCDCRQSSIPEMPLREFWCLLICQYFSFWSSNL